MRHYRDLALAIDNRRKMKRNSTDSGVIISGSDASCLKTRSEIPIRDGSPDDVNSDDEEFVDAANQPVVDTFDDDFPRLERRNSYTLENPSPILLEYVRSQRDTGYKKCEIFIDFDADDAELAREMDDERMESVTMQNFEASVDSPSSDQSSDSEQNIESIYNSFSTIEDLGDRSRDVSLRNDDSTELGISGSSSFTLMTPTVYDMSDSFSKDFQLLDLNASYESDVYDDSRYSEDSVSLSKYLTGDGEETERNALEHLKKQLQIKHSEQFKQLLQEQQKEHDNLKLQFGRISSLSDKTASPHYAYSSDVVLKKYSASGRNTEPSVDSPGRTLSRNENTSTELSENCVVDSRPTKVDVPVFQKSKKLWTQEDRDKAVTQINALVRGFLTRRLLKTDYVVTLVQTIKDCLIQAVSLQNEPDLGLSELEFQSRILQQVN